MARLFKRGNIWYAWIGRTGGGTIKVSTQCSDKKAAEKRAGELERDALDPDNAAANRATTADACNEFLGSRIRRGRAEGTIHHYRVKLGHVMRIMPSRLSDINAAACERFIEQRLSEGAEQTTVKKEIRALGATLRHARRHGTYVRVVEAVIPELEDTYKPRERFITPLELVALCNALPKRRAAHVVFIVATGARWGESVRAKHADVATHMVYLRGTKTAAAPRTVPVPPTMRLALEWSLSNAPRDGVLGISKRELGTRVIAPVVLFSHWGNVCRDLANVCAELGIAAVTPNDLRRTFATWLSMSGVTPDIVGKALGHTTSRMADLVYGRISADALDKLITERGPALDMGPEKESEVLGLLMGGDVAETGPFEESVETGETYETPTNPVPGDGIEPPTRGFSIPIHDPETTANVPLPGDDWVANGLSFRARGGARVRREAFWRIARTWLERGWWNEVHALGPYVPGAPRGKR